VTSTLQSDVLYDTSTGSKKQVYVAVSNTMLGFVPSSAAVLTLNLLAEQQTPKDYRQYTYRKSGSITVVNGLEDGVGKKVLRYTVTGLNPDQVEVYVDGVKRDLGTGPTQFQLYDGTVSSPVPPNSVLFNTAVTGTAPQIDVIVTKASTLSTVQLVFNRAIDDEARLSLGAWEGIDKVSTPLLGDWSLFYLDFTEVSGALAIDVKLRLNPAVPSTVVDGPTTVVQPSQAAILLSRSKLHTQLDRQRSKFVRLDALSTEYLMIKLVDGVRVLYVTEDAAMNVFPVLTVTRFDPPTLITATANLVGNTDAAELDNTIIVGPDT
jgi:hypothetical protein